MIELNLIPDNPAEQRIKKYLEENVSEILAEKINNGVKITKNGITLINKKSLKGFMKYATKEAQKAVKKESYACIEDETVFGWAIHYFEEDSIEEKLYNEDGTENKEKTTTSTTTTKTATTNKQKTEIKETKPTNKQFSIFDMLSQPTEEKTNKETIKTPIQKERKVSAIYTKYMDIQKQYPDCIVIYRLGDFYEIIGKKAETAAKELDLTLTGKDFGLEERIPIVGIPYHTIDNYIAKLITKNYKVAISEDNKETRLISTQKQEKTINEETGEIINENPEEDDFDPNAFDPEALTEIIEEFDNKIIVE